MKKLLIVGAGSHGWVVKEIAETVGGYEEIDFADDNSSVAVGVFADLEALHREYDAAIVSIGNNQLRKELLRKLAEIGYDLPVLIHPTAYISKSSKIGCGTIVGPKAIVNTNVHVGEGCIISAGAIVDHDAHLQKYVHINAGAIVKAGAQVREEQKVDAGQVVKGM